MIDIFTISFYHKSPKKAIDFSKIFTKNRPAFFKAGRKLFAYCLVSEKFRLLSVFLLLENNSTKNYCNNYCRSADDTAASAFVSRLGGLFGGLLSGRLGGGGGHVLGGGVGGSITPHAGAEGESQQTGEEQEKYFFHGGGSPFGGDGDHLQGAQIVDRLLGALRKYGFPQYAIILLFQNRCPFHFLLI